MTPETQRALVEALRDLVGWGEEHRAMCKRLGERPIPSAHMLRKAQKALARAEKEGGS